MTDQERKGDDLVRQAEKKLKAWSWGDSKYYDAAELYEKAGTAYKVAKAWQKGGDTFLQLSELHLKQKDSQHEAASSLVEAANCYKKANPAEASKCLQRAVDIFVDLGRLNMAARHCKDIAETYEKEDDREQAMEWYEKAADFYASESAQTSVNQMKLKVAEFAAIEKQYSRAIEIYEQVARDSARNNLLRYSVKTYLLNAGICLLCLNDSVAVSNALDKYSDLDPGFPETREFKLLTNLSTAIEEGDEDMFTEHVREYDDLSRLDSWKTTLLLRAKQSIANAEEALV